MIEIKHCEEGKIAYYGKEEPLLEILMIRSGHQCKDLGKSSPGRRKQNRGPETDMSLMSIEETEVQGWPGEKGMIRR